MAKIGYESFYKSCILSKNSLAYPAVQCAAVIIHLRLIKVPPHTGLLIKK